MLLYRIGKTKYIEDLTGEGCLKGAGRWHLQGTRVLYTSASASLAKLEVLANAPDLPKNRSLIVLKVPDTASILFVEPDQLPRNWYEYPYPAQLPMIAKAWIDARKYWIMRVPSAQLHSEYNYLLNPLHEEHSGIVVQSVQAHPFDPRLKGETKTSREKGE
jgi:RES domain-containing protein